MKPFRIVAFTLVYTLLTLVLFSPNNLLTITPMAFLSLAFGFVTDWAVEELSNYLRLLVRKTELRHSNP